MTTEPEPTIGARVAADLRDLADIAANIPELADALTEAVAQLHVVLRASSTATVADFQTGLAALGCTDVAAEQLEPHWATQAWQLPAGAVQLTVTQLAPASFDMFAAG